MIRDTPAKSLYLVNITSTGGLGTNNHRVYNVTVTGIDTTTPPPDDAFVTTWEVETSPYVIHMPVEIRSGATATIDWGDGNSTTVSIDGTQQHTYADAGNYTVAVTGGLGRINLAADSASADKLRSIDQWGNITWTTMEGAFSRAGSMVYRATGAPDLSGVSSMKNMFSFARSFTGNLSEWDVSSVTDMESMFSSASAFNGDISGWDVSSVTTMKGMFVAANKFNGDISGWNVSSVTDMFTMFAHASEFNQDISGWNVSSVTDMTQMLTGANGFSQNLGKWYITLDSTSVDLASDTTVGTILPQNGWLADNQIGAYGIAETHDHGFFEINGTSLNVKDGADYTGKTDYVVSITSTHPFGAGNQRLVGVTVTDSSSAFVTTWEVETSPYVIHMPVEIHTGATATIDWGDGSTTDVGANGRQDHTYADCRQLHGRHHRRAWAHQPRRVSKRGQARVPGPVGRHGMDDDGTRVPQCGEHGIQRHRRAGPFGRDLHGCMFPVPLHSTATCPAGTSRASPT